MGIQDYNQPYELSINTINGEPVSIKIENETHVVYDSQIMLSQLPDVYYKVIIENKFEQSIEKELTDTTQFKVDYKNSLVYLHPSLEGTSINIKRFYGKGIRYLFASRVKLEDLDNLFTSIHVEGAMKELAQRINNLISGTSQPSEIVDAHLDSNTSTTYPNLKNRLDTEYGEVYNARTNNDLSPVTYDNLKKRLDGERTEFKSEFNKIKSGTYQTSGIKKSPIRYRDGNSIFIYKRNVIMGGFRFMGEYIKPIAPLFTFETIPQVVDFSVGNLSNTSYETSLSTSNWYAVFAVANDGESPQYKIMPFLRAYSVAGNVITLGEGGEFSNDLANSNYPKATKEYTFSTNVFADAEVLVINESDGLRSNQFVGRVAHVTANTSSTITLDDIGTITSGCYLLIAPPDFDHYCYLGSFYRDSAEVRNISDGLEITKAHMVYLDSSSDYLINGDISTGLTIDFSGFIPPLAIGVSIVIASVFSTSSTGEFSYSIGSDNVHFTFENQLNKRNTSTENFAFDTGFLPFTFGRELFIKQNGLSAGATRKFLIKGWIEP